MEEEVDMPTHLRKRRRINDRQQVVWKNFLALKKEGGV